MTEVKICGLTREQDVEAACALGASRVGFVFAAGSARRVSVVRARELAAAAPAGVLRTGVFTDAPREQLREAARDVPLDVLQLHRAVTPEDLGEVSVVAAVRADAGPDGLPDRDVLARCDAILFDSSAGAGQPVDWARLAAFGPLPVPVFVAGGLDAGNVGALIRALRPAGVDVASGVERAPGLKDREMLRRFFAAVREADQDAG